MNKELFKWLTLISSFIVLLPLFISLLKYSGLTRIQKKLTLFLFVVLIVEIVSNILWYKEINNHPIYHIYTVLEFLLILNIYNEILTKLFSKTVTVLIGISFIGFAILNILLYQDLFTFNSNTIQVLSYCAIFIAIASFYSMLKMSDLSLFRNTTFLISTGILLYFSSNLVLFHINNSLDLSVSQSYLLWGTHAIINIISILFYTLAIWVQPIKL